ncbi:ABC transporter A family member 1 [Dorcoceras hygrometricum]|uniref:ABC transporter A family member 1 n=1 Tax=Dorcoceras hygrometricum TaxID=472368 RepID=A0A2Z7BZX3_9LAMI|nr:ABC transporter A family member 1 [Dorcoceras hygrometricum]
MTASGFDSTKLEMLVEPELSLIAVDTPIRSTTRFETPSSDCTRSPDEISTIGFSTSNWPEQISGEDRRRRTAGGGGGARRGGEGRLCASWLPFLANGFACDWLLLLATGFACDWLLLLETGFACDWFCLRLVLLVTGYCCLRLVLLATGYCCLRLVSLATDSFP